jgi:hypothetical protein
MPIGEPSHRPLPKSANSGAVVCARKRMIADDRESSGACAISVRPGLSVGKMLRLASALASG